MIQQIKDHPDISPLVHPPIVALIHIAAAYLLGRFVPLLLAVPSALGVAGLLVAFLGFLCGIAAFIEFRKAHTTLDPHGSVTELVTSGIYRFTRNPIYLGFLLMVIGLPLYWGFYSGILVAPFYVITLNRLVIEREEAYLEKKFKDRYTVYRSRVRRWL